MHHDATTRPPKIQHDDNKIQIICCDFAQHFSMADEEQMLARTKKLHGKSKK